MAKECLLDHPKFESWSSAQDWVRDSFPVERERTPESEWIAMLEYFETDSSNCGYLIMTTSSGKMKSYLFKGVSETLFKEWVASESKGKFYHQRVRGKYGFKL